MKINFTHSGKMLQRLALSVIMFVGLSFISIKSFGQTTVFIDDFNRAVLSPGGSPGIIYTSSSSVTPPGVSSITSNYLNITSGSAAGRTYVTGTLSGYAVPFNSILNSNSGLITWTFNMRCTRSTALNGFGNGQTAVAMILAADNSDLMGVNTKGYAITLTGDASGNKIDLGSFTTGLSATTNFISFTGPSPYIPFMDFISVKVTYLPSTNTWALFVRDDGGLAFSDPTTGTLPQVGAAVVNAANTSVPMSVFGFFYNHTTSTNAARFDNFKVTVTNTQTNYYYSGTGDLSNTSNWGTNTDGLGSNPSNFTSDNQIFNIRNTAAVSTISSWTVSGSGSKIIVGDPSLTPTSLTIANGYAITGTIDIPGALSGSNRANIQEFNIQPAFGSLHATSEVHYQNPASASVTVASTVTYGKLFVDGTGSGQVQFSASNIIQNSFNIAEGSTVFISGGSSVYFTINSGGNVVVNGRVRIQRVVGFIVSGVTGTNGGSIQFQGAEIITLGPNSTIEYNRNNAGTYNISPRTYVNLSVTGSNNDKVFTGPTIVTGSFSLNITGTSTITGCANLMMSAGSTIIRTSGTLDAAPVFSGSVNLRYDQNAAQVASGYEIPSGAGVLNNLVINSTGGVSLASAAAVNGTLSFGDVNNSSLVTNGNLVLRSEAQHTAVVADITNAGNNSGNSITGNVTVERYIGAPTPKAAWRLLTAPLRSTGGNNGLIYDHWQNGGVNTAGIGTQVTGPGGASATTGIDAYTVRPGVQYFDHMVDQNLHGVTDTKTTGTATPLFTTAASAANKSYFIFTRGDRSVNPGDAANNTTLRPTGTLQTGDQAFATAAANANDNTIVGNPYAAPVDLNLFRLANTGSNVKTSYYYWDPYLTGTYGVGGYVTVSYDGIGTETITPAGASHTRFLQSGQAMFLERTLAGTGTAYVTFKENLKATTNAAVFLVPGQRPDSLAVNLNVLVNNAPVLLDGTIAAFDMDYATAVDDYDAGKFPNVGENLSLKRSSSLLAIERRGPLANRDTLFLNMSNMKAGSSYRFHFAPGFTTPAYTAFLQDSYMPGSNYPLSITAGSSFDFAVTADAATAAANRFRIVFAAARALAVSFNAIRAYEQNRNINVEWKVENEADMKQYEVERSADGSSFTKMNTTAALNQAIASYTWTDVNPAAGYNFYRIRSTSLAGEISYSDIVKVLVSKAAPGPGIYPNPIQNNTVNLKMNNMPAGTYHTRLINALGQVVQTSLLKHAAGSSNESISLGSQVTRGTYTLDITGPGNSSTRMQVLY